jgi:deoxyribodipyrimidine photo-lyase
VFRSKKVEELTVFWFRRDLRLDDNHGLHQALKIGDEVLPVFIFDTDILARFPDKSNRQAGFLIEAVNTLKLQLIALGSDLHVFYGSPMQIIADLVARFPVKRVFANEDYEPEAKRRDDEIARMFREKTVDFQLFADQLVFNPGMVLKSDGTPYSVFTPFANRWKQLLAAHSMPDFSIDEFVGNLSSQVQLEVFDFNRLGYRFDFANSIAFKVPEQTIIHYHDTRNFPALTDGTTHVGVHLRFGTISIRKLVIIAQQLNEQFLNELIWREFFMHILFHFPHVVRGGFKKNYDRIEWRNNEAEFLRWCKGETGIPLVDAGIRELNATGFMHNRVRMVVASFLTKHLLIDWRWGEAYFAQKLIDYELSSNNGNWQWAAGSGCDATPYFRIFNPYRQQERFDPQFEYIARWVPEYNTEAYKSLNQLDLALAKERCLIAYKRAIG